MFEYNKKRIDPFRFVKEVELDGTAISIGYKDRGYLNSGGIEMCDHPKEEYDNSIYENRGTNIIYICHQCRAFWHVDMSD